jgi:hypothetical protein
MQEMCNVAGNISGPSKIPPPPPHPPCSQQEFLKFSRENFF